MSILSSIAAAFVTPAPAPANASATPAVTVPASPFGTLMSGGLNTFFTVITALGGGIAGSGILPNLLDPNKGPLAALAHQNTIIGAIMVGLAWWISNTVISGSNATTVAAATGAAAVNTAAMATAAQTIAPAVAAAVIQAMAPAGQPASPTAAV